VPLCPPRTLHHGVFNFSRPHRLLRAGSLSSRGQTEIGIPDRVHYRVLLIVHAQLAIYVAAGRLIQADRPRVGDPCTTPVFLNLCETAAQ